MWVKSGSKLKCPGVSLALPAHLDVCPGDGQDGTGAPGGSADGSQGAARVDRVHGHHGVAGQEGRQVGLPGDGQQGGFTLGLRDYR